MPDKKARFGILGAGLGIVFVCLAFLVNGAAFRSIDSTILSVLQAAIGQKYRTHLSLPPLIGSTEVTALVLALFFAYVYFRARRTLAGLSLFFALFVVEFWGKSFVFQPEPPSLFSRQDLSLLLPGSMFGDMLALAALLVAATLIHALTRRHHPLLGLSLLLAAIVAMVSVMPHLLHYGSLSLLIQQHPPLFPLRWLSAQMVFSFPSGHITRATFVCMTLLTLPAPQKAGTTRPFLGSLLAVLLLTVMSVSLMSRGSHWFSDVLGGVVLGASMGSFAAFVDAISQNHAKKQVDSTRRTC